MENKNYQNYATIHFELLEIYTMGRTTNLMISKEEFLQKVKSKIEESNEDINFIGYLNFRLSQATNENYLKFIKSALRKEKILCLMKEDKFEEFCKIMDAELGIKEEEEEIWNGKEDV